MADRASIGLERPWMRAYAQRLVQICHRRGAHALGGMAAFTPGKTAQQRDEQTAKVMADKQLEASLGHDGCWVSHPYFIGPAMAAFPRQHQKDVLHADIDPCPDLLPQATPPHTLEGLRTNVRVGIAYMEGWQRDLGCIAWDGLMEDLATLEISRAQTWQWCHHRLVLDDGTEVHAGLVRRIFVEELQRIGRQLARGGSSSSEALAMRRNDFERAAQTALALFLEEELRPFLCTSSQGL
jgi:malate synthase